MAVRPFMDFLREQRAGELQDELSQELNNVVAQVERMGKKGTITLTIEVAPVSKEMSGQVVVRDSIVVKLPKAARPPTLFFTTPENNLSRKDFRQNELELKPVVNEAPPLKQVGAGEQGNAG